MSDSLATYLHDHLAGSAFAIDLVESLRDHYAGDALGEFASDLLIQIKQDRMALQQLADRIGKGSPDMKEATAWVAEKVTRFKLSHDRARGLGTFQALELLALGIQGKLALWRALIEITARDDRVKQVDLDLLAARAENQHAQVEKQRLMIARTALVSA
jgi:hypothetical protein